MLFTVISCCSAHAQLPIGEDLVVKFADSDGRQPTFTTFLNEGTASEIHADVPVPPGETHNEHNNTFQPKA